MQLSRSQAPLTVSALTKSIKQSLETSFPSILVQGEISNFKRQASGHLYFSIKDEEAQISCVMFRGDTIALRSMPKLGDQVLIRGELNVYPPRGNYQIIVRRMEPTGLGQLLLNLERLKRKLEAMGWFSQESKQALPKVPKTIGLVTSPTGAALRDMLQILRRRCAGFNVILNPVRVQGEEAAGEIAEAIHQMNQHKLCDVLIVGRGGGSMEDLWPFNDERVAKAIFESSIPIISAVGHETDWSIADYVADVRAPTPSAAAELVSEATYQQLQLLAEWQKRLDQQLLPRLRHLRSRLNLIAQAPFLKSPRKILELHMQRVDEISLRLDQLIRFHLQRANLQLSHIQKLLHQLRPTEKLATYKAEIQDLHQQIFIAMQQRLRREKERVFQLQQHLNSLDPKNLLQRGYSILFSEKNHSVILSAQELSAGDQVYAQLGNGKIVATVNEVVSQ